MADRVRIAVENTFEEHGVLVWSTTAPATLRKQRNVGEQIDVQGQWAGTYTVERVEIMRMPQETDALWVRNIYVQRTTELTATPATTPVTLQPTPASPSAMATSNLTYNSGSSSGKITITESMLTLPILYEDFYGPGPEFLYRNKLGTYPARCRGDTVRLVPKADRAGGEHTFVILDAVEEVSQDQRTRVIYVTPHTTDDALRAKNDTRLLLSNEEKVAEVTDTALQQRCAKLLEIIEGLRQTNKLQATELREVNHALAAAKKDIITLDTENRRMEKLLYTVSNTHRIRRIKLRVLGKPTGENHG